jgi:hypothetical protein
MNWFGWKRRREADLQFSIERGCPIKDVVWGLLWVIGIMGFSFYECFVFERGGEAPYSG